MTIDLIKKLEKKINQNISLKPIFENDENETLLKQFLYNQDYLKPENIFSIIKINFLKDRPIGYILCEDNSKIIGFLGTIYSKRKIHTEILNHCYLHSWIVSSKHRSQAFRLLTPILEEKIFISTFSPIKSLEGLYLKLGFSEKSFQSKFVFILPRKSLNNKNVNISENEYFFKDVLSDDLKKIYEDHLIFKNNKILIYFNDNKNDNIFVIAKKKYKKFFLPVLEIIYVSDPEKYKKNMININFELFKKFKTIIFKENFFNNKSIFSQKFYFTKKNKGYFKNVPKNSDYNFLYSELLD
tara:strand:+ start:1051 stop:1944 length:894 start_codon:yes stop_codon:yes gene_type:complete